MNTNTNQTAQNTIQVWTDPNGAKFAAELTEPGRVIFAEYETGTRGTITPYNAPIDPDKIQADVAGCFYAKTYNRDGLTWIEARELEAAARDQNPIPERSLANAISYPERIQLDDETREEIISLLTKRYRAETTATIRRRLQNIESLKNHGIFDRLQISPTVSYCAGQDYPAEIRAIRELIIKN